MSMLVLEKVACLRGHRLLFADLDLTLEPGGATIVTGPNGAGKSSLLRIAAGLLRPDAGRVRTTGEITYLGEGTALDPERTLWEALRFWARLDRADAALERAMAAMGVADLAQVPVGFLSTGQRRRAAIARTIARSAALWLLDEPTNGLDDDGIARLGRAIDAHRTSGGAHVANCGYLTDPVASGRGVATAMAEHSFAVARARGFRAMQFNFVVESNVRAVALWQRLGFMIVGRLPRAFDHPALGIVDALVMMRDL